jgi:hypothetical protein
MKSVKDMLCLEMGSEFELNQTLEHFTVRN